MLFNSIPFLIFFPIVTLLFYAIGHKYRWVLLLAASCFFYMFFVPQYILILLITILIDYTAGIYIEKTEGKRKKSFLILSIVTTCLVLVIFKYLGFFHQNMISLSHYFGFSYPDRALKIILPIGLSFHTFQNLSYMIEVYRGKQKAEKHFGVYSLYVIFYPQLVTDPNVGQITLMAFLHATDAVYEQLRHAASKDRILSPSLPTLIRPCIEAGCPPDGMVLDPFMGTGTMALIAKKLGINCMGIELNNDYVRLAEERLEE